MKNKRNLYISRKLNNKMMKKSFIFILLVVFLLTLVLAQTVKMEVSTIKESFSPDENITLKILLFDSNNNPINGDISLVLENADKTKRVERTVQSNKLVDVDLKEDATAGFWKIIASYGESDATGVFSISSNEKASFELNENVLTVKNIGNTKYEKQIQILIGDSIGIKQPSLGVGETVQYRLIAPEGTYNIKITDGVTSISRGNVKLTGEAIGILDDRLNNRAPITGSRIDDTQNSIIKQNPFVYIFVLMVVGATILLAIERYYRKKR